MRTRPLSSITGQAWGDATRLLRPFRWSVWWRLLVIAMFSGQLASGCSTGFRWPGQRAQRHAEAGRDAENRERAAAEAPATVEAPSAMPAPSNSDAPAAQAPADEPATGMTAPAPLANRSSAAAPAAPPRVIRYADVRRVVDQSLAGLHDHRMAAAIGIALLLLWSILLAWLMARFSFVFVDVLATGRVAIAEPFRRLRERSRPFFHWLIAWNVICMPPLLLPMWWTGRQLLAAYALTPDAPLPDFLLGQLGAQALWLLVWIALVWLPLTLLWVWSIDFVVPIMYRRGGAASAAMRDVLGIAARQPDEAASYLLWKLLLLLVVGAVWTVGIIAFVLGVVIVGGLIVALGVLLIKLVPALTLPLAILGAVLAIILVVAIVLLTWLVHVIPAVWMRSFSLRYLEALDPTWQIIAPVPTSGPSSPSRA